MIASLLFALILPTCCIYALVKGGVPERLIAAALVAAAIGTALTGYGTAVPGHTRWGVFAVDLTLLMIILLVALRADRLWILPLCSLQLLTVLAHVVSMMTTFEKPWAYAASIVWTGFLMPPLLAFGTFSHQQRLRQNGADPSWRNSSSPSSD